MMAAIFCGPRFCARANVRDAQSDLCINNDNKNDQFYLCMTIAIEMVHQYFHPSDLVIKSTYLSIDWPGHKLLNFTSHAIILLNLPT